MYLQPMFSVLSAYFLSHLCLPCYTLKSTKVIRNQSALPSGLTGSLTGLFLPLKETIGKSCQGQYNDKGESSRERNEK